MKPLKVKIWGKGLFKIACFAVLNIASLGSGLEPESFSGLFYEECAECATLLLHQMDLNQGCADCAIM